MPDSAVPRPNPVSPDQAEKDAAAFERLAQRNERVAPEVTAGVRTPGEDGRSRFNADLSSQEVREYATLVNTRAQSLTSGQMEELRETKALVADVQKVLDGGTLSKEADVVRGELGGLHKIDREVLQAEHLKTAQEKKLPLALESAYRDKAIVARITEDFRNAGPEGKAKIAETLEKRPEALGELRRTTNRGLARLTGPAGTDAPARAAASVAAQVAGAEKNTELQERVREAARKLHLPENRASIKGVRAAIAEGSMKLGKKLEQTQSRIEALGQIPRQRELESRWGRLDPPQQKFAELRLPDVRSHVGGAAEKGRQMAHVM